jgi:hypothetical protein
MNSNGLINPKFGLKKQGLLIGFMCHIKQHIIDHKYGNLIIAEKDIQT